MLASGKCFSVSAKGVGLGGFEGGAEEQQQLRPGREARGLLKAAGRAGTGTRRSRGRGAGSLLLSGCNTNPSAGRAVPRRREALSRVPCPLPRVTSGSAGPSARNIFATSFLSGRAQTAAPVARAPRR